MKRFWAVLPALAVTLMSFGGASLASSPASDAGKLSGCTGKGHISFMFYGDKGARQEEDNAIALAEKSCPGLTVDEQWTPSNYDTQLPTRIGSGNAPDVFLLDTKRLRQYVARNAVANLDPYIKKAKLNMKKTFTRTCLPMTHVSGHYYGLLRDCASQGMLIYNKEMFDARHVKYPTDKWTYKDFLKAAKALTGDYSVPHDPTSKLRFGYGMNTGDVLVNQYVLQWGGSILSSNFKKCELTSSASRAALQWWVNLLYQQHGGPTSTQQSEAGDPNGGFRSERYAMIFAGPYVLNYVTSPSAYTGNTSVTFPWGGAMAPKGPKNADTTMAASVFAMSRTSAHKNAAWWLIRYLSQGKPISLIGQYGLAIPGDIQRARDPIVKQRYGALLPRFTSMAKAGKPLPAIPQYDQMWTAISTDLTPMWQGTASVKDATTKACNDAGPLLP